jgi:hypothetical protein
MTNKEVLEGLQKGHIFENEEKTHLFKIIDGNLHIKYFKLKDKDYVPFDKSINCLYQLKPYEPAPEKPTWWKHEYYSLRNGYKYEQICPVEFEESYNEANSGKRILIKSTPCQADTIEEAVKILEGIK